MPVLLLVLMAIAVFAIKQCKHKETLNNKNSTETSSSKQRTNTTRSNEIRQERFERNATKLYFTKHAKCRMKCRHITQKEVKEILAEGTINYNKSDLQDPKGPTYALEGNTDDGQRVRIIFAPKQKHLTVVTVIDLEKEYACNCD